MVDIRAYGWGMTTCARITPTRVNNAMTNQFKLTNCSVWIQYTILFELGMITGLLITWAIMS